MEIAQNLWIQGLMQSIDRDKIRTELCSHILSAGLQAHLTIVN